MDLVILSRHAVTVQHLVDYTKICQTDSGGGKNELINFNKLVYLYPGPDQRQNDAWRLLDWCFSNFRSLPILSGGETEAKARVWCSTCADWISWTPPGWVQSWVGRVT